jgi:hypothetical protein
MGIQRRRQADLILYFGVMGAVYAALGSAAVLGIGLGLRVR